MKWFRNIFGGALQFPEGRPLVRLLPWTIAALGVGFALGDRMAPAGATWCVVASGLLLGGVDVAHRRLGRQLSRVLADIVLMTPYFLLLPAGFPGS